MFLLACAVVLATVACCGRLLLQVEAHGRDGARVEERSSLSMSTPEHLRTAPWWPTKPATSPAAYAGTAACAQCHAGVAHSQAKTEMARTLLPVGQAQTLLDHLGRGYRVGDYQYETRRAGQGVEMTVSEAGQQRKAMLEWAFGSGELAQSYLWTAPDGTHRESRFNFFAETGHYGPTPGRLRGEPTSIDMAVGRAVDPSEAVTCFSCHTTAMFSTTSFSAKTLWPGVSCEACHGPGAAHVRLMKTSAGAADLQIVNPANLKPETAVDLCGSCHGTAWDTKLSGAAGPQTVRFPAYRLEKSRCWGAHGDPRLTCFGCHDPHAPLERKVVAYDAGCLSCHVLKGSGTPDAQHPGKACPVAVNNCTSCHMPKVEVPDMHHSFTDHMIRIVRKDQGFPD